MCFVHVDRRGSPQIERYRLPRLLDGSEEIISVENMLWSEKQTRDALKSSA